jgi:UDP-glucose:(heptosyl)LPS alpha-1,3-glucosyltransferase
MPFNRRSRRRYAASHRINFDLVLSPGINCFDADIIIVHALFHRLRELSQHQSAESTSQTGLLRGFHRSVYYALLRSLERKIYSRLSVALVALSPYTADLMTKYFQRSDIHIVPNGVETQQFAPAFRLAHRAEARRRRSFSATDFVLLLIGNDCRIKGLPTVLAAMAVCRDLPLQLVVAGSDDPSKFLKMAQDLGVANRLRWEPPRPDVIDLYAASDLYVSPTREDSFALPVAEAMACGLPVVTSVFNGVSGFMQDGIDGMILSDPLDTATLAKLIRRLYEQPALRQRMGAAAAHTAEQWTWDRNAAAIYELIEQTVAAKSALRNAP